MKITSIDVYDFGKCLNYEDCSPICIRINTDRSEEHTSELRHRH